jgi:hypothetical protein
MVCVYFILPVALIVSDVIPYFLAMIKLSKRTSAFAGRNAIEKYSDCDVMVFNDLHIFKKCKTEDVGIVIYDTGVGYLTLGCLDALYSRIGGPLSGMKIDLPEGVNYEPGIDSLEACAIYPVLRDRAYGGMPIQLGMCWGRNTKLNCLEYHRDSEVNIGAEEFILLLAKRHEIRNGVLDTARVKAFRVPAGLPVEVFADTLHYAPCHTPEAGSFRVAVVLPLGTNTEKPAYEAKNEEDTWMTARNKWLLAHPDSAEAQNGAHIGLRGENIDIAFQSGRTNP